jgi:uridine phosphorylase
MVFWLRSLGMGFSSIAAAAPELFALKCRGCNIFLRVLLQGLLCRYT